jgi:hypothetical protein
VVIRGQHHDLTFRSNTIGSSGPAVAGVGILAGPGALGLRDEGNRFMHVRRAVQAEGR